MKINELTTRKPQAPMTPAEARLQTYKNQVKNAQDALKRERQAQHRRNAHERIQSAQATLQRELSNESELKSDLPQARGGQTICRGLRN